MDSKSTCFILNAIKLAPTSQCIGQSFCSSSSSSPFENAIIPKQNILFFTDLNYSILPNQLEIMNNQSNEYKYKRKKSNKLKFSSEEDKHLLELVSKYGDHNWKNVALEMEGRTIRQCRDRYRHYVSPTINQEEWSEQEDKLLLKRIEDIGCKWKKLEKFFINRNEIQIRNRYYQITHINTKNNSPINNFQMKCEEKNDMNNSIVDNLFNDYNEFDDSYFYGENESEYEENEVSYSLL